MYNSKLTRRLRKCDKTRALFKESKVGVDDIVLPVFISEEITEKKELGNMPGVFQFPINDAVNEIKEANKMGIKAVVIRPMPKYKNLDDWNKKNEFLKKTLYEISSACPEVSIIIDNYFQSINKKGYFGVSDENGHDDKATLDLLAEQAVHSADAGAEIIVTLGRVDNEVMAVRSALNESGFEYTPILSYAANFASTLAHAMHTDTSVANVHKIGSYRSKIDIANTNEAMSQVNIALDQGADIIGVKPGFFNMDIISKIRSNSRTFIATYVVSKEYSMVKAAAAAGYLNEKDTVQEMNASLKRSGANKIMTYWAKDVVNWIREGV